MFEIVVCHNMNEFLVFVKLRVERKPSVCSDCKIPRFCAEFSMEEEHVLYPARKGHEGCPKEFCLGIVSCREV